VKAVDPNDPEANRVLGLELLDGRWVTEKESFTARGFVQFEGEWMTPVERQAILEERQAIEAADREVLAAQIEADQAQQAEEEAREAEEDDIWGGPLDQPQSYWDHFGYFPAVWPAQPGTLP
jgi:hypothetical protein